MLFKWIITSNINSQNSCLVFMLFTMNVSKYFCISLGWNVLFMELIWFLIDLHDLSIPLVWVKYWCLSTNSIEWSIVYTIEGKAFFILLTWQKVNFIFIKYDVHFWEFWIRLIKSFNISSSSIILPMSINSKIMWISSCKKS